MIGSSPRVRGTAFDWQCRDLFRRFIPACAGNRASRSLSVVFASVHPRVCGEQTVFNKEFFNVPGSSPRVRGTVNNLGSRGQRESGSSPRVRGTAFDHR